MKQAEAINFEMVACRGAIFPGQVVRDKKYT